jgi:predicted dithiol-disulfide oxidoreductase (DUF899 family)
MVESLHDIRFPHESKEYREARNALLLAERDLRRQTEHVAAQRRALPRGGEVAEDYSFDEIVDGAVRGVRLSELFGSHDTLVAYNYMFSPKVGAQPCPMCTSMLDGMDGQVKHLTQRAALAVIARAPIDRVVNFAHSRGWRDLRLVSSANNSFNTDYHGEKPDGSQQPALHVFARRDGKIFHTWSSELLFAPEDSGQNARHIDLIWPLWNVLDATPRGRGTDWYPKLAY